HQGLRVKVVRGRPPVPPSIFPAESLHEYPAVTADPVAAVPVPGHHRGFWVRPRGRLSGVVQRLEGAGWEGDRTTFTGRGYAIAEFNFRQVAIDNKDRFRTSGIYQLFGDKIDCGALMAWAWGVQRVIDALETIPEIDAAKGIVTGHSRYGKAAL